MDFDWSTFVLEIINFLVLVWILKHFLYRPILDVIKQRRADIEKEMADARRIATEADALKRQSEQNLAQWTLRKDAANVRLREELAAERERLMSELETSITKERERHRVLDEREQRNFQRGIEEQGIAQGASFAARLLGRVASPALETRLYALLLEDLRSMRKEDQAAVTDVAATPGLQLKVQSAFVLDAAKRAELEQTLSDVLGKVLPVEFLLIEYRENPELLAGLQVSIGPWILHANLRDELQFFSGALRHVG